MRRSPSGCHTSKLNTAATTANDGHNEYTPPHSKPPARGRRQDPAQHTMAGSAIAAGCAQLVDCKLGLPARADPTDASMFVKC